MLNVAAVFLLGAWGALTLQTIVNLLVFRRLAPAAARPDSRVSIVIPARNEERYVGRTLDAALAQDYDDFEVVIVDDDSSDATPAEIDRRRGDPRLVPVVARTLEPGWLGKPNALATGAARATGEWLLFMDADISLHPLTLLDAVAACEQHEWDYLALLPEFRRRGFWEELLMPLVPVAALIYMPSFLSFVPGARLAAGGGAFALVRKRTYDAIGGHASIKSSVVDDIRLAMEVKKNGFRSSARIGTHRVSLRMYHGLREIVDGFTKNAHTAFGRSIVAPSVVLAGGTAIALAPFTWPLVAVADASRAFQAPWSHVGASLALVVLARALVSIRLGFPLWPIVFSPVTTLVSLWITWRSLRMARGDGVVRWRGREYEHEHTEF